MINKIKLVLAAFGLALMSACSTPTSSDAGFKSSNTIDRNQKIVEILKDSGFKSYWSRDISLWVENPGGLRKLDMEKIGNSLCKARQTANDFFVVTFWQNINGPNGLITKVSC